MSSSSEGTSPASSSTRSRTSAEMQRDFFQAFMDFDGPGNKAEAHAIQSAAISAARMEQYRLSKGFRDNYLIALKYVTNRNLAKAESHSLPEKPYVVTDGNTVTFLDSPALHFRPRPRPRETGAPPNEEQRAYLKVLAGCKALEDGDIFAEAERKEGGVPFTTVVAWCIGNPLLRKIINSTAHAAMGGTIGNSPAQEIVTHILVERGLVPAVRVAPEMWGPEIAEARSIVALNMFLDALKECGGGFEEACALASQRLDRPIDLMRDVIHAWCKDLSVRDQVNEAACEAMGIKKKDIVYDILENEASKGLTAQQQFLADDIRKLRAAGKNPVAQALSDSTLYCLNGHEKRLAYLKTMARQINDSKRTASTAVGVESLNTLTNWSKSTPGFGAAEAQAMWVANCRIPGMLAAHDYDQCKAARAFGISRAVLQYNLTEKNGLKAGDKPTWDSMMLANPVLNAFITELEGHGDVSKACRATNVSGEILEIWCLIPEIEQRLIRASETGRARTNGNRDSWQARVDAGKPSHIRIALEPGGNDKGKAKGQ